MNASQKTLIVISGPTASGKIAAGIALARHYQTVVVSADSRQFYREMGIGTAKPTTDELSQAKHYFIDTLSITEKYTAGDFERDCLKLLAHLFETYDEVVMVGGSGLFIKAICEGFDAFPDVEPGARERLKADFEQKGIAYLQERLKIADPDYYEQVDHYNPQRLIRALEVFDSTGKPYSSFRKAALNERPFRSVKFGINLPRELLYDRINRRVDEMISLGLIDEVKSLLPYRHLNALATVGYAELLDYFDGKTDLETAISLIKQNTRRFAKRQMTWFNRDKEMIWVNGAQADIVDNIICTVDSLARKS